jgi:adenylosuccinate synthase
LGEPLEVEKVRGEYEAYAERLRPMVRDTARLLNTAIASGQRVLFEGAQGTMLDIDHGTYPFVTSSSPSAGGVATGTGVPPSRLGGVVGVSKAYITRVGSGPFPTEAPGEPGQKLRDQGDEYGAVTGRPRRCGWFDAPLLRYTAMINGFDTLVITKLDVLDHFAEIPVCVAYRLAGKRIEEMPATTQALGQVEPTYETLPGWSQPTSGVTSYRALPARARDYLRFLEEQAGVEIGAISIGPERQQTILRRGSKLEKLMRR